MNTICVRGNGHGGALSTGALAIVFTLSAMTGAFPTFDGTAGPDGPFNTGGAAIAFGVADLGPPVSPGAPTYLLNNFNGRADILTNPGLGLTADPSIPNNTSFIVSGPWGDPPLPPGGPLFLTQVGGGNANGPFGAGAAVITGPQFGYALRDGGIPGGFSASYEILSWDASFTEGPGSLAGTVGTYITMAGRVPLVQDLALVSLRTEITGPTIGVVEVPGLILAVERTGALTYNLLALQDNGIGGVTPMPGGAAILIDNAVTGDFRALAFNAFPDLGAIDGLAFPAGEKFTARVTATIFSDPSELALIDPNDHPDLIAAAVADQGTPFPTNFLFTHTEPIPEPMAICLALVGVCMVAGMRGRANLRA